MMVQTLNELYNQYFLKGSNPDRVRQKICQDIFISKLTDSEFWNNRVVFKGGIVMYELTRGQRGYTKDIDIDFIQTSLTELTIQQFIDELNHSIQVPSVSLRLLFAKSLHHKTYKGLRLFIEFIDTTGDKYHLYVDIGVHTEKNAVPECRPYEIRFLNRKMDIQIDPNELSIVEKLMPFAVFGSANTRYRDLFDIFWRITYLPYEKSMIIRLFDQKIKVSNDFTSVSEAFDEILSTLRNTLYRKDFYLEDNWIRKSLDVIFDEVIHFVDSLTRYVK
jgi:hypothetical protein